MCKFQFFTENNFSRKNICQKNYFPYNACVIFSLFPMRPLDGRQRDILEFLTQNQEYSLTLADIGAAVGIDHPQKVLDKIDQLLRM